MAVKKKEQLDKELAKISPSLQKKIQDLVLKLKNRPKVMAIDLSTLGVRILERAQKISKAVRKETNVVKPNVKKSSAKTATQKSSRTKARKKKK